MDLIEKAAARLAQQEKSPGLHVAPPASASELRAGPESASAELHALPELHLPELHLHNPLRSHETPDLLLNIDNLARHGMVLPNAERSRIKEEFRHIKRPLLMNSAGKGTSRLEHANLIMVTSSHPGEGKTFTAANLALSIAAERDKTVLLVDCDVVRPSLGGLLGYQNKAGVVDYLMHPERELSELILKTDLPTLSILPAGTPHHLSTELLASDAMQRLTTELSQRYSDRIVIFDSPPLLVTTESCVLAHLMGQIVIVVEAERSTKADIRESLDRLGPLPETAVGFVLNKTRQESEGTYYGYGYGY